MSLRDIELERYEEYLKLVSSLSGLFSDSDRPLINYRTAEKLFCLLSGASDVGRSDCSFDASITQGSVGIGVKTFTAPNAKHRTMQKVAEFSRDQHLTVTGGLWGHDLARKVAELRNTRVSTDAKERGLVISRSYYHCVVRLPSGVIVHEEPYELVSAATLKPLTPRGKPAKAWPTARTKTTHFTDGKNRYTFHAGKNTLFKEFDLSKGFTSKVIPVVIIEDVFTKLMTLLGSERSGFLASNKNIDLRALLATMDETRSEDFVVLPLFSSRSKQGAREVAPRSGINQWNARGRARTFGESYIPVPSDVRVMLPDFFPPKDQKFVLKLPNGKTVKAKICQADGKALMAAPNKDLLEWLFDVIDGDISVAEKRLQDARPYTYADLVAIGKDSVRIRKLDGENHIYSVEFDELGAYDAFLDGDYSH